MWSPPPAARKSPASATYLLTAPPSAFMPSSLHLPSPPSGLRRRPKSRPECVQAQSLCITITRNLYTSLMLHVHPAHAVRDVRHLLRKVEALALRLLRSAGLVRRARRRAVHARALLGRALAVLRLLGRLLVVSLRRLGVRVTRADARVAGIRILALRRVRRRV